MSAAPHEIFVQLSTEEEGRDLLAGLTRFTIRRLPFLRNVSTEGDMKRDEEAPEAFGESMRDISTTISLDAAALLRCLQPEQSIRET